MSKVIRVVGPLLLFVCLLISVRTCLVVQKTPMDTDGVSIQIYAPNGSTQTGATPRVLVLISNRTQMPIVIDRHLAGYPARQQNSLSARVYEAKSGEEVGLRAIVKRSERVWSQSDLLVLDPDFSYGLTIDLREYFSLRQGSDYRVRFEYRSIAPPKVGHLRPWSGVASSPSVVVHVPRNSR